MTNMDITNKTAAFYLLVYATITMCYTIYHMKLILLIQEGIKKGKYNKQEMKIHPMKETIKTL